MEALVEGIYIKFSTEWKEEKRGNSLLSVGAQRKFKYAHMKKIFSLQLRKIIYRERGKKAIEWQYEG